VSELVVAPDCDEALALNVAQALAATSSHPLATAIVRFAEQAELPWTPPVHLLEAQAAPGRGITGRLTELKGPAFLGSRNWLAEQGQEFTPSQAFAEPGSAALAETLVAWQGRIRGRFLLRDDCRPEARRALAELQRAGLHCLMLTGDRQARGEALAKLLGMEFRAQILPENKLAVITQLRTSGPVIMVGDGINDAPALAAAEVGVALASGTDISRQVAGVCLLANDLTRIPWLVRLARQTVRAIHWNLLWAFAYNVAGIGLAAMGWLHPIVAALAMGISGLLVVGNSLVLAQYQLPSAAGDSSPSDDDRPTTSLAPASRDAAFSLAGEPQ
jgi:P-type E1-E2 ATPase